MLQAAVGNHFRDKIQSMPAVKFIETRQLVQEEAFSHIREHLAGYEVDTKGVYIQDVILPEELVKVLTQREIANQEIATFGMQQKAQQQRIDMECEKGTADMQAELARAKVGVEIKENNVQARRAGCYQTIPARSISDGCRPGLRSQKPVARAALLPGQEIPEPCSV